MGKLLLHLVTAIALVLLGRSQEWPWWLTTAAVIAGFMGVHLLFERVLAGPVHLGAAEIADDDPLMLSALAEAKRTWSGLLRLYPQHPQDTMVKYRLRTTSGDIENVWGDLLELRSDDATVYLRTPPVGDIDIPDPRMVIPVSDIVDWQIEFTDGSLRGGFTQQATFRILEREQGSLPRQLVEQLARYRPVEG
jgi:hypothetical protein